MHLPSLPLLLKAPCAVSFRSFVNEGTFVATCEGQLVGLCTVTPEVDIAQLCTHFNMGRLSSMQHYSQESHGEVSLLCLGLLQFQAFVSSC